MRGMKHLGLLCVAITGLAMICLGGPTMLLADDCTPASKLVVKEVAPSSQKVIVEKEVNVEPAPTKKYVRVEREVSVEPQTVYVEREVSSGDYSPALLVEREVGVVHRRSRPLFEVGVGRSRGGRSREITRHRSRGR